MIVCVKLLKLRSKLRVYRTYAIYLDGSIRQRKKELKYGLGGI
jgi:hypothetical protein